MFFGLAAEQAQHSHLSDANEELILCWRMVHSRPSDVSDALRLHAQRHSKSHYLQTRAKHRLSDPVERAARFIYLNKTCFNGLYRVNKQGRFNVPCGNYRNPAICDEANLAAVSAAMANASLRWGGYEGIFPSAGDLVYCDPPYDGTFTAYTGHGFEESDQRSLRDCAVAWADAGAHVVVSNSDTDLIRKL